MKIKVQLIYSDNKTLQYPCNGEIEILEVDVNGVIIVAVWRGETNPAPVRIRNPHFVYPMLDWS